MLNSLRMIHISDRSCTETQTHILCSIDFFFFENRTVYEIMWYNMVQRDTTDGSIIRCMRFTWTITKATDRHSEYVIIIAYPLQQC